MAPLLLVFALVFVGLAVLIAIFGRWGQGFFYENVVDGLTWRSIAVAAGITAFFALWAVIECY